MSDSEYIASIEAELDELRNWKVKYTEASELWDALEIPKSGHVDKALLIAKIVDFERGGPPEITASVTDGVDWVDEWGLIASWQAISNSTKEYEARDPEDE